MDAKTKKRNSPVIGDNGITATKEDINNITGLTLEIWKMQPIDIRNPEHVYNRITEYFDACIKRDLKPGNLGLYASLGMSNAEMNVFISRNPKHDSVIIIKKARVMMGQYREQLMVNGKVNPVTGIFWQKNYDGLRDVQEVEVSAKQQLEADKTPEEIAKAIDIDVEELD